MSTAKPGRQQALGSPLAPEHLSARTLIDQIADKWSVLILGVLCDGPLRFSELRRRLDGITQKSLTDALRRLERNGIVSRTVLATSPIAVEYEITPLGRTLKAPLGALQDWAASHLKHVERARAVYLAKSDRLTASERPPSARSARPAHR